MREEEDIPTVDQRLGHLSSGVTLTVIVLPSGFTARSSPCTSVLK